MTRPSALRSLRRASVPFVALATVFGAGCNEVDNDVDTPVDSEVSAAEEVSSALTLAEFTGRFDAETGEFTLELVPPEEWQSPRPEVDPFRTVPQALWCEIETGGGSGRVALNTVAGSIGYTLAECGIPDTPISSPLGAFCATISLTNNTDDALSRPMAEIIEVTPNWEGYRYWESQGVVGVDPTTLGGPNPPSDLVGLFGYADLEPEEEGRSVWAFHNPGTSSYMEFNGRIVAEAFEECNGLDDDCDGFVDEAAGCFVEGDACASDFDCETGNCTVGGTCGPSQCSDGLVNGSESDIDCGGACDACPNGDTCNAGLDCESGNCRGSTCVQDRYPAIGEIVINEVMIDGGTVDYQDFEWFEIVNTSADTLDLDGCVISDGEDDVFLSGVSIAPGAYQVFVRQLETLTGDGGAHDTAWANHLAEFPGSAIIYDDIILSNSADELSISCPLGGGPQQVIDEISWAMDAPNQAALQLHPASITAASNNAPANLCPANISYFPSYFGTPGAANSSCNIPIDACRLIGPATLVVPTGSEAAYSGRVLAPTVTGATPGTDAPPLRMIGQIGNGPTGTSARTSEDWTWEDAAVDPSWSDAPFPGWDGYVGTFDVDFEVGETRDVGFRWSGDNGATWTYCDGLAELAVTGEIGIPDAEGEIVVTEFMGNPDGSDGTGEWFEVRNTTADPLNIGGCRVSENAGTGSYIVPGTAIIGGGAYAVFALDADATNGPSTNVLVEYSGIALGNGGDGITIECPAEGGGWLEIDSADYADANSGISVQLDTSSVDGGLNDSSLYWCETAAATTYGPLGQRGTPGASNVNCYSIGFCRIHAPEDLTAVADGAVITVYGRNYVEGLTPNTNATNTHPLIVAELGYGDDGTDPSTWTTWANAPANTGYNGASIDHEPNNDEYMTDLTVPGTGGPWDVAYRFSANGGTTWTYCDRDMTDDSGNDGSADGYQPANSVPMSLAVPVTVGWCSTHFPQDITAEHAGETVAVYGRVFVAGLTEPAGPNADPSLVAQHGYGADGSDPATWTTWEQASINTGTCATCGNNDEYQIDFEVPTAKDGPYDHGFRFSGDGGATWSYCDRSDDTWTVADAPSLVPNTWFPSYCHIQYPDAISANTGTTATVYGRVFAFEPGGDTGTCPSSGPHNPNAVCLTARSPGVDESDDFIGEFGFGANNDPTTWTDWTSAIPNPSWNDASERNNDEYQTTITLPAIGNYSTAFRFSGDGGASWTYCGANGVWNSVGDTLGTLEATSALEGLPYNEPFTGQLGRGAVGPTPTINLAGVDWTVDVASADLSASTDWFQVVDGGGGDLRMEARDVDGPVEWRSPAIDISGVSAVQLSVDIGFIDSFEATDLWAVGYYLDGSGSATPIAFGTGSTAVDQTVTAANISGSEIVVAVSFQNNAGEERMWFDDVSVSEYTGGGGGGGACLRFSQYVEGSGSNKGVELWNCGTSSIDLSDYEITQLNCGSSSCTNVYDLGLSGTLGPNDVVTWCNNSWALSPSCDQTTSNNVLAFNGNDTLLLVDTTTMNVVDTVGTAGNPAYFARDVTLDRIDCTPNTTPIFEPGDWMAGAQDYLGGWGVAPICLVGP